MEPALAIIDSIPTRAEQLALEPTVPSEARAGLRAGATLFDQGRYWDAHEAWEDVWQVEPRPIRSFYQGLIQIAAGFHHWTVKHRPAGVQRNVSRGVEKLGWYAPGYLDVDVDSMIADAERLRTEADGHDQKWLQRFPPDRLPVFRWLAHDS